MSSVIPFKGVLYNPEKISDLTKVMAPPYDVISPEYQQTLYDRDPANIIRLILAKEVAGDAEGSDKYSRAEADYKAFLGDGTLARDAEPAIYFYTQTYDAEGTPPPRTRKGFIALKKLVEFGSDDKSGVHPHEKTLSGPKADRLKLMKACKANLSCIFSLYSEPGVDAKDRIGVVIETAAVKTEPIIDVTDDDGVVSKLWRVADTAVLTKVTEAMEDKPIFIADGHHRYETALNYKKHMHENGAGSGPHDYVMMYFSSMDDTGLTIFPTHRAVHSLPHFDAYSFLNVCREYFSVSEYCYSEENEPEVRREFLEKLKSLDSAEPTAGGEDHSKATETLSTKQRQINQAGEDEKNVSFGLIASGEDAYFILTLRGRESFDRGLGAEAPSMPDIYKDLDVTVLHSLVLARMLKITPEAQEKQSNIRYIKSTDKAFIEAKKPETQAVFIMNPTKIEQVRDIAEAGHVMPQKSTYFYPKLLTGLVVNSLRKDDGK
ncbi:MAG: DUF1015 domain-containing protein [Thermodesulfobacteriota bacterium]